MKTSPTWPRRSLGVPVAGYAAVATLVAVLLLALSAASSATADAASRSIYWTNSVGAAFGDVGTTIGRANNDATGVNQAFIGGASLPTGLAVDTAHVYWINDQDKSIGRADLDGTGVNQRFITGVTGDSLAVDGGHIYWTDLASVLNVVGTVGRANLDGTGIDQNFITTSAENPSGVAVDGAHVYWTNPSGHAIGRANLDGTGVNQNFLNVGLGGQPFGIAVDTAHIYWTDLLNQAIGRVNLDGTALNPTFIEGARFPLAVAVDSAHIYWTDFNIPTSVDGADGAIGRANLDGTGVNQTFITGAREPEGVAVGAGTQTAPPSRISIGDARMAEGNAGQSAFRFTVSLDQAQSAPMTVDYSTADGTATAASDYAANSGTLTFAPGETAKTITVQVNGDTTVEPNETFTVNLANATGNATIADGQATGTILNDDQPVIEPPARVSINDVSKAEGNTGQTAFRFTVSLDQPKSAPVTVDFDTGNVTATAPSDYVATTGTVTFAPGETAETVTVQVNGDTTKEANETFNLNLANVTGNATIADGHAVGTIVNDDRKRAPRGKALNYRACKRLAATVPARQGHARNGGAAAAGRGERWGARR
jgi:streptogramin lyase